jgi:hypothetical protein
MVYQGVYRTVYQTVYQWDVCPVGVSGVSVWGVCLGCHFGGYPDMVRMVYIGDVIHGVLPMVHHGMVWYGVNLGQCHRGGHDHHPLV